MLGNINENFKTVQKDLKVILDRLKVVEEILDSFMPEAARRTGQLSKRLDTLIKVRNSESEANSITLDQLSARLKVLETPPDTFQGRPGSPPFRKAT